MGVDSAQYQLSLYNLTAPINGVVEAVNVTQNNFAASGQVAFVISNGNNKTVTFYVTDSVRQTLTPGQAVTVTYNGQSYEGAVTEIGGVVDAQVGQFRVKAIIDGSPGPARRAGGGADYHRPPGHRGSAHPQRRYVF